MSNSNKYIKFESVDRCITKYTYKGKHPRFRVRCKHKGIGTFDTLEEAKQCRDNYEFGNLKRTGKYRCHEIYGNSRQTIIEKYKKLQEQLNEANELLKYCCANYESSRFGATITEYGEILPKGPVWNYLKKLGVK